MEESRSLDPIRKKAYILLAIAAKDVFQSAVFVGGKSSSLGFYYEFVFPFVFQDSFLPLIEEKMGKLIRDQLKVSIKEMVPFSAKELFLHRNEPILAQEVEQSNASLVQIAYVGNCAVLFEECEFASTQEVGAVKLKSFEVIGKRGSSQVVRIWGAAHTDKQKLKEFLKKELEFATSSHLVLGQQMDLFSPWKGQEGAWLWHPKGYHIQEKLLSWLKNELENQKFSIVSAPLDIPSEEFKIDLLERARLFPPQISKKISEVIPLVDQELDDFSCGLLKSSYTKLDLQYVFCKEKQVFEDCISSLQFIMKMLKILRFEFTLSLCLRKAKRSSIEGRENKSAEILTKALQSLGLSFSKREDKNLPFDATIEFWIHDALDRPWVCSFLSASVKEDDGILVWSVLGSLERIVALLLERHKGVPLWLAPTQVIVLAATPKSEKYAKEIEALLVKEGFRVESLLGVSLKESIHRSSQAKIPYIVVVGDKEEKTRSVTIRRSTQSNEKTLPVSELIEELTKQSNRSTESELQNK